MPLPHRIQSFFALAGAAVLVCASVASHANDMPEGFSGPRGSFHGLGTHRIHMSCTGSGAPTVIFESGLGGSSDDWIEVQTLLQEHHRSCAYDRAGYGWSDPGPLPRTSTQIVDELTQTLALAKEPGPFILVGHSFGGLVAQEFASRHPERVVGTVLIDSSHPNQERRLGSMLTGGPSTGRNPISMPVESEDDACRGVTKQSGFLNSRRKAVFAQMNELKNFAFSGTTVAALSYPQGIPGIVVKRGLREAPAGEAGDQTEQAWSELQSELASRIGAPPPWVGERSGHNVHLCEPELVIEAIEAVSKAAPNS